jgi:hypothetical protein
VKLELVNERNQKSVLEHELQDIKQSEGNLRLQVSQLLKKISGLATSSAPSSPRSDGYPRSGPPLLSSSAEDDDEDDQDDENEDGYVPIVDTADHKVSSISSTHTLEFNFGDVYPDDKEEDHTNPGPITSPSLTKTEPKISTEETAISASGFDAAFNADFSAATTTTVASTDGFAASFDDGFGATATATTTQDNLTAGENDSPLSPQPAVAPVSGFEFDAAFDVSAGKDLSFDSAFPPSSATVTVPATTTGAVSAAGFDDASFNVSVNDISFDNALTSTSVTGFDDAFAAVPTTTSTGFDDTAFNSTANEISFDAAFPAPTTASGFDDAFQVATAATSTGFDDAAFSSSANEISFDAAFPAPTTTAPGAATGFGDDAFAAFDAPPAAISATTEANPFDANFDAW